MIEFGCRFRQILTLPRTEPENLSVHKWERPSFGRPNAQISKSLISTYTSQSLYIVCKSLDIPFNSLKYPDIPIQILRYTISLKFFNSI